MIHNSYIECSGLSKHFHGKNQLVKAVDNITFKIEKEEFVIIKGRSGSGKSTLLSLIGGLIRPTSGIVRVGDNVITGLNNVSLARLLVSDIGIIFQNFNLLPTYTIYENIEVALVPKDMEHSKMRSVIMSTLEQFNLGDKANMLPSELSAGQQQKVAVVRTLVKNPSLILADEPTGSVDEETSDEIIEYLSNLKNNSKATVLLATHGGLKESIADRTIILDKGTII